jgi:superfamily II DNA or RNA helicase
LTRGYDYASRGLVTHVRTSAGEVRATVQGSSKYEVVLALPQAGQMGPAGSVGVVGRATAVCSCPAYDREGRCKHIVALAVTLFPESAGIPAPLPPVYRTAYSASRVFGRLALYVERPLLELLHVQGHDRYSTAQDWWWEASRRSRPGADELQSVLVERAPEVADVVSKLAAFTPPPPPDPPGPASTFAAFYARLAELYVRHADSTRVRGDLPGPLDGRHPGFVVTFDSKRRTLSATERAAVLLPSPQCLSFEVPTEPGAPLPTSPLANGAFTSSDGADAWGLFALRALLLELAAAPEARQPDVARFVETLAKPVWEQALAQLADVARLARRTESEPREWLFELTPDGYQRMQGAPDLVLRLYVRMTSSRSPKWKRQPFEALLASAFEDDGGALEREIARLALCASVPHRRDLARDVLVGAATAHGHELLRALARHPRVVVGRFYDADPEALDAAPAAAVVAGKLTMQLLPDGGGNLVPRFFVDDVPLGVAPSALYGAKRSPFFGAVGDEDGRGPTVVSVEVPPSLRPWLEMATKLGDAFVFPPDAVDKLVATTEPLVLRGHAALPRNALGEEAPFSPAVALRVEWTQDPEEGAIAHVEAMVVPAAGAPFVRVGSGARLFTFEHGGKRFCVERDRPAEATLVRARLEGLDVPVAWDVETLLGATTGLEQALALAAYLDENPHRLPIEVKIGRPPTVVSWPRGSRLSLVRRGSWLAVDGQLDIGGTKLTLGEILEALRVASRFVRVKEGVFLELSLDAVAKLRPLAAAADLGGGGLVHEAFGSFALAASELFDDVRTKGIDVDELRRRFSTRKKMVRVPTLDHGELRPYQGDGVAWILRLASWAPGCVLADDMGLGKTVQTAAVLKARAKLGPALVIAPASVSSNWLLELRRFVPSLRTRWYNAERDLDATALRSGDVLVVSYGLLQRQAIASRRWATVVVDEAQYVKNVVAQRRDAVRSLERDFTVALTGTPLENHLGELYSVVDVAFPGLLGTEPRFRQHFRRPIEVQRDAARLGDLSALVAPFLLRRTRAAVLADLPPREQITEYVDLSPPEARRYAALRRAAEQALGGGRSRPAELRIELLAALTRLRQMACDVRLVDPAFDGPSTKIDRVVELAVELAAENNRALVFSQFTQFLDKVRVALEKAGLRVAYLTGETPTTARRAIIDRFQAGEYDVFCVSLLAGGTGLNLTRASYVIHLDPWWNPAAEEQATSRAHRLGQTEPVTVYRLVARGTIEEAVLDLHADKRGLAGAVLEGKAAAKSITPAELLALLRFGEEP